MAEESADRRKRRTKRLRDAGIAVPKGMKGSVRRAGQVRPAPEGRHAWRPFRDAARSSSPCARDWPGRDSHAISVKSHMDRASRLHPEPLGISIPEGSPES